MIVSFSIRCFFATVLCTVVLHPLPAQERSQPFPQPTARPSPAGCLPFVIGHVVRERCSCPADRVHGSAL